MKARRRRPRLESRPIGPVTSHFKSDGSPKQRYRTETEAKQAAQASWAINGVDLQTYRCDFCHQWHMGKPFSRN
jgi:hypothetical protein